MHNCALSAHRLALNWRLFFTGLLDSTVHIARIVAEKATTELPTFFAHISSSKLSTRLPYIQDIYNQRTDRHSADCKLTPT